MMRLVMLVFVLTLSLLDVVYAQEYSLLWKYETGDWVRSVAISSDGKYIVAGSSDKNVYLFNREGELLWKYKTGVGVLFGRGSSYRRQKYITK